MSLDIVIRNAHVVDGTASPRFRASVGIDQGRIVEEGTHSDLLAKGGLYSRYWNRQSGGFIGLTEAAE